MKFYDSYKTLSWQLDNRVKNLEELQSKWYYRFFPDYAKVVIGIAIKDITEISNKLKELK